MSNVYWPVLPPAIRGPMKRTAVMDVGPYAIVLSVDTKSVEMHSLFSDHAPLIDEQLHARIREVAERMDLLGLIAQVAELDGAPA